MNHRAKSIFYGCVIGLATLPTTACLFRVAPKMPKPLASMTPINYSPDELKADVAAYRAFITKKDQDAAKAQRDQIAYRIMAQIDSFYGAFELNLSMSRAGVQTASDATQLGLSAAATVVGASEIKDILSATSTAFQGTRLSFDKNYFEQKTTEALISQMRASRKNLQAQIINSLAKRDVNSYPLESAWGDIVNYYYAGTIPSALVDIASKAGNDAVKADKTLTDAVKGLTTSTPAQAQQALANHAEYEKLSKAISSGDSGSAHDTLVQILTTANIPFDSGAPASGLLEDFKQAIVATKDDNGKLQTLYSAVKSATGQ